MIEQQIELFTPPTLAGERLSKAEARVFNLIANGWSSAEIADMLLIKETSANRQKSVIYRKCGVRGQVELLSVLLRRERKTKKPLVDGIAIAGEVA